MSKTVTSFTAQLVTFDTPLKFAEVVTRLEKEVNKAGSAQIIAQLKSTKNKAEIESIVNSITGSNHFLYFLEFPHHGLLNRYYEGADHPAAIVYTIGNPLIAQTIMHQDLRASYNIPPRLLVLEKEDRSGTNIIYHLPSSVMALTKNAELKVATDALDKKLEEMVQKITSP